MSDKTVKLVDTKSRTYPANITGSRKTKRNSGGTKKVAATKAKKGKDNVS